MSERRRRNIRARLAEPEARRALSTQTIQAIQATASIDTPAAQARRAYIIAREAELGAFFALTEFDGRGEEDGREEAFVNALNGESANVMFGVRLKDLATIATSPIAYQDFGLATEVFGGRKTLDPTYAKTLQGVATGSDPQLVRQRWEVLPKTIAPDAKSISVQKPWVTFAKGGEFSRFYQNFDLILRYDAIGIEVIKTTGRYGRGATHYFRAGMTWPLRTQRGFNLRIMPRGCIFGHKGPALFVNDEMDEDFILGVLNSAPAEFLLKFMTTFGAWEVGVVQRLPIPNADTGQRAHAGSLARAIYDAKVLWDTGNEISAAFVLSWLLQPDMAGTGTLAERLDQLLDHESTEDVRIQNLYRQLNNESFGLYGIAPETQRTIEMRLGARAPELVWPATEGLDPAQKRMEHVWRMLSCAVKRVLEADDDGIVPLQSTSLERSLHDRVLAELLDFFPGREEHELLAEIHNELGRKVKGYARAESLATWLEDVSFEYHAKLYKSRPVFWHLASKAPPRGSPAFGVVAHYHRFDHAALSLLRSRYVKDALDRAKREAARAGQEGRDQDALELGDQVREIEVFDAALRAVLEGSDPRGRIRVPWKDEAHQPKGWRPELDDGVRVNLLPWQSMGLLRVNDVITLKEGEDE